MASEIERLDEWGNRRAGESAEDASNRFADTLDVLWPEIKAVLEGAQREARTNGRMRAKLDALNEAIRRELGDDDE